MAAVVSRYGIGDQTGADADTLVQGAMASGVQYLDTAAVYGESESAIGQWRRDLDSRGVRICTKVGASGRTASEELVAEARQSVERLGGAVDTLLVHSARAEALSGDGVGRALDTIRLAGLATRTGASTYGSIAACEALHQEWCHTLQIEFSLLNQQVWNDVQFVRRAGQEVVARSVLCKGLLTDRADAAGPLAAPVVGDLAALRGLAISWGYTLPELAIRFALDTPGLDIVLVGVSSDEELGTAIGAAAKAGLTDSQMAHLRTFDRSALDCVHPERWSALTAAVR